ncbi:hypothetical protein IAI18_00925 [Acetobacteraceae bacterium H6797]|nr:hypothetical protein [Acetobacteraceae bacterium H6797]
MMMNRRLLLAVAAAAPFAGRAFAQSPSGTPARLRGSIDSLDGRVLHLTLRNGSKASVQLPENPRVTWLTVAQPSEIQPGSYIGTAAVPLPDGSLKALEIQVFPPSMRGVGEGHRAWDLAPQSTMTNGTVGSLAHAEGRTITLTYNGGEKRVIIPDDVPIVTYAPADVSALTPGAKVIVNGTRAADGTVTAGSISVGKDGLTPPM